MEVKGLYRLVSFQTMDMETFEKIWMTNEELNALPADDFRGMVRNANFDFADGCMSMCTAVPNAEAIPEEEIKQAVEAGQAAYVDGKLMLVHKYETRVVDGVLQVNSGEEGEIFGEKIDPFKNVEEFGNTLIILDAYQIVPVGEEPSEVKKTVKAEKVASEETKAAAGTYIGQYTKFVGDTDDAKNTSEPFKLVLNEDGTGTSYRNDLEIRIPDWSVEGGVFKMTEKFLGTIDYTGKLEGNKLNAFNGDPDNALTCEYVYEKQ